jgi:hypothetical protein
MRRDSQHTNDATNRWQYCINHIIFHCPQPELYGGQSSNVSLCGRRRPHSAPRHDFVRVISAAGWSIPKQASFAEVVNMAGVGHFLSLFKPQPKAAPLTIHKHISGIMPA